MLFSVLLHLITFAFAIGLLVYGIGRRRTPKALYFIYIALFTAVYAAAALLEATAPSGEAAITAHRLGFLVLPCLLPAFYLFIRDYCGRALRQPWKVALLFAPAAAIAALTLAWPAQTLFWQDLLYVPVGASGYVHPVLGPLYILFYLYCGAVLLLLVAAYAHCLARCPSNERLPLLLFALAAAFPALAFATQPLVQGALGYSPSSLVLTISAGVLAWQLSHFRYREWMAFGREAMVESLRDAFILVDSHGCFRDANPAAYQYFPALAELELGDALSSAAGIPAALTQNTGATGATHEFTTGEGANTQYLRAYLSPLTIDTDHIGTCILFYDNTENHRLMAELQELATHDALTGLLNRGTLFQFASRDFSLCMRNKEKASVLMIDIDLFKQVNDRYGHAKGDEVLANIAATLVARLRHTDICGRYGGEELAVWLPGARAEGAAMIANVIRRAVEQTLFTSGKENFHVTISIGVAELDFKRHDSFEAHINDADAALYAAKSNGRNQVSIFQP